MLLNYLLERVIRHYVQNVEQVLQQISISRLLFGSVKLKRVEFAPESIQDALFSYIFFACEFRRAAALDVEVRLEWLSIATRSVQFRIGHLDLDVLLYDPAGPQAADDFWGAQAVRLKAESEYTRNPAESTLLYKVLGGFDLIVEKISVNILVPDCERPQMLVSASRFRYCPASESGSPTNDLTLAMRPNELLGEVAYNYWLEVGRLAFSVPSNSARTPDPKREGELALEGLTFSSAGKAPANGRREAPFYATSLKTLKIGAFTTKDSKNVVLSSEVLVTIVELLSRASSSDALRDSQDHSRVSATSLPTDPVQADFHLHERLRAAQQTKSDMADLLAGCSRTSRQQVSFGDRPPRNPEPKCYDLDANQPDEDSDEFRDCEEEEEIHVGGLPGSGAHDAETLRECFRQGALSRFIFNIEGGLIQLACPRQGGSLVLAFKRFGLSSDRRREFLPEEVGCLCATFELPSPAVPPSCWAEAPAGLTYFGMSLESISLQCSTPEQPQQTDIFRLHHGLKLRHRGLADTVMLPQGPMQIVEVEVVGLLLRDHGRGLVLGLWEELTAVLAPSPSPNTTCPKPSVTGIGYSLQASELVLEAGAPKWWRCAVPCLRLSSVVEGLDDLWAFSAWDPEVIRSIAEPLGSTAVPPLARPWWEPPRRAPRAEPVPRRRSGGPDDVITELQQKLLQERAALDDEKTRTSELEAKLQELVRVLQSWPEGPLPLAVQKLLDETRAADNCLDNAAATRQDEDVEGRPVKMKLPAALASQAPQALPVELATYNLEFGKTIQHVVEGLRRGDAVQWFLEEVQDRLIDTRAVLRSQHRLHAARCLRETEHTNRKRDFFQVTDDFGDEQLPLTLEIHLSNSSWFTERRVRFKLCKVEGAVLAGCAVPWPAFTSLLDEY